MNPSKDLKEAFLLVFACPLCSLPSKEPSVQNAWGGHGGPGRLRMFAVSGKERPVSTFGLFHQPKWQSSSTSAGFPEKDQVWKSCGFSLNTLLKCQSAVMQNALFLGRKGDKALVTCSGLWGCHIKFHLRRESKDTKDLKSHKLCFEGLHLSCPPLLLPLLPPLLTIGNLLSKQKHPE